VYYRFVEDLRYRENRRLVKDLIPGVYYRFIEDLRYRENRRAGSGGDMKQRHADW